VDSRTCVPLPFELPRLSRGFVALTPAASGVGARAAAAAAASLGALLGREVTFRARPCAGAALPRAAAARIAVDFAATPGGAVVEVEPALVVALVDALAGGTGAVGGATWLTPIEASALELFALAALDGASSVPEVEQALAPRLSRGDLEVPSALAIELHVAAGPIAGRGRLLVSAAAVAALGAERAELAPGAAMRVPLSVRSGRAPVSADELAALCAGDVLLLDAPPATGDALVLPGGARIAGRLDDDGFHAAEVLMAERHGRLPVVLEVELARVEVPVAELARLDAGAVLPLGIDRRGVVTLRAGDRAVARGELVDVEGSIGVRVLALEDAP
jgi:type III secretion system YscQ/HrcQ family protein